MKFLAVLTFLGLVLSCEGGALLTQGVKAAKKGLQALGKTESQADDIATAIFNGKLASMFGIRADGTFFGDYVIVNSQLYKMSNIAGGAAVFGGAGAVAGGVAGAVVVSNSEEAASVSKSLEEAVQSTEWLNSVLSQMTVSSIVRQNEITLLEQGYSSILADAAAVKLQANTTTFSRWNPNDPDAVFHQTFAKRTAAPRMIGDAWKRDSTTSPVPTSGVTTSAVQTSGVAPPPPGTPVSSLPASAQPTAEIPPGIPEYNFRMCQNDLINMNLIGQTLEIDTPSNSSISVSNLPSTCMVLAPWLIPSGPENRPQPIPMGSASLLYTNVEQEDIDCLRIALGVEPIFFTWQQFLDKYGAGSSGQTGQSQPAGTSPPAQGTSSPASPPASSVAQSASPSAASSSPPA